MGTEFTQDDGRPLFEAELRPNRSLSASGFRILMAAVSLSSLVIGLAFYLRGAWPVVGFLGLDVAAVYLAFRLNYRAGRLTETVRLSHRELSINRVHPDGRRRHWSFHPYWARVRLEPEDTSQDFSDAGDDFNEIGPDLDIGGQGSVLVTSHGRGVRLGRFLAVEERRSFAEALNDALRRLVGR